MILKTTDFTFNLEPSNLVGLVGFLKFLLFCDHVLLQDNTFVVNALDDFWNDTLAVGVEQHTIRRNNGIFVSKLRDVSGKKFVGMDSLHLNRKNGLRRHIVLNNKIGIQRVQVE